MDPKQKVKIKYASGNLLVVPNEGHAPGLFLEWLGLEQIKNRDLKITVCMDSRLGDYAFYIRLENAIKETFEEAKEYINNNL